MKSILIAVLLTLMISGCHSPTGVNLGEQFQLKYGQNVFVPAANFTVTFTSLGDDSRCPEGALCFWAGNARVVVSISGIDASLNTTLEPREVSHSGYNIQLLGVNPYPKLNEHHVPEDYSITLVVTKE
jgi:hypothetical protein